MPDVPAEPFNLALLEILIQKQDMMKRMVFHAWRGAASHHRVHLPVFTGFRKLKCRRVHGVVDLDFDDEQPLFAVAASSGTASSSNDSKPSGFLALGCEAKLSIDSD